MPDIVTPSVRRQMMAGIRSNNTKPELTIRKALHKNGFRFRCNVPELPGKPDIVLPKYLAVIQIHGCLWHQHECHLFSWPCKDDPVKSKFWHEKISGNKIRDNKNTDALRFAGWRVAVVWECALKGKHKRDLGDVINQLSCWLLSDQALLDVQAHAPK